LFRSGILGLPSGEDFTFALPIGVIEDNHAYPAIHLGQGRVAQRGPRWAVHQHQVDEAFGQFGVVPTIPERSEANAGPSVQAMLDEQSATPVIEQDMMLQTDEVACPVAAQGFSHDDGAEPAAALQNQLRLGAPDVAVEELEQ